MSYQRRELYQGALPLAEADPVICLMNEENVG